MTHPNQALMKEYGNEQVFFEKTAGIPPLLERLVMGLANEERVRQGNTANDAQRQQAELLNEALREMEMARVHQATDPLQGPSNVRLASIASQIGTDLAKQAGIGTIVGAGGKAVGGALGALAKPWGWKGQALMGAGAAGAGLLGMKALRKAPEVMGREVQPQSYGSRFGYQIPFAVNSTGQPQLGTPL
jgi:hypothetical protein